MRIVQADHKEDSPCVGTGECATADYELDAALLEMLSEGAGPLDGDHHVGSPLSRPASNQTALLVSQAAWLNEPISFDFDP